ncbi:MAG: GntR family transcriptional repressor for pyruvate dehydrogenase complex [Granulosicoccus sp.]|jgi:GntR family transcriptional repressor for pyruvate dehydrogenase complex
MFYKATVPLTISRKLQEMIDCGELKKDEKIPSQRVLSETLKVSRASLREALLTLETLGLVRTFPARGTYVVGPETPPVNLGSAWRSDLKHPIKDVFQSRLLIECELCRLAATRITKEEVASLRSAAMEFISAWREQDLITHVEADLTFHKLIAEACPNAMLRELYSSVQKLLSESQRQPVPYTAPQRMEASFAEHRAITDALEAMDPALAVKAMNAHIKNTAFCAGVDLTI